MNWGNITLKQYQDLSEILGGDSTTIDKARALLKYLYADRYDNTDDHLVLLIFNKEFEFLMNPPKKESFAVIKKIDTFKNYSISYSLDSMTVAQFMDICNYDKNIPDRITKIVYVLSALFIPKGKSYNDGYDISSVAEELFDIPALQGFAICEHLYRVLFKQLRDSYPAVFGYSDDEPEEHEERGYEESALKPYGMLPYIMSVASNTNEKYTDIYNWSITHFCYVVSYLIIKAKEDEKNRLKWKKTH